MPYKKIYLEWEVEDVQYNSPVGFEVEFSRDKLFNEITTSFNTWDENSPYGSYRFEYSLDEGQTWTQFPWGSQGETFTTTFRMRLKVTPSDMGYSLAINDGVITKISADSNRLIDTVQLNFSNINDADQYGDILYLVAEDTIYKIDGPTLSPYKNSLPLLTDNTLGIVADESRGSFWQVNGDSIWLRNLYGDILWTVTIPEVELDFSSSSSSSSTSLSSSSSLEYSSSSSSSSLEYSSSSTSSSSSIDSSSSSSSDSSESIGNISSSSSSSISESSESIGNESSSSSSSSESSLGVDFNYMATGFDAFPLFQGRYHPVKVDGPYYIYHNDNNCILQFDSYGGISTWKLYLNETNRSLARDHYYITPSSTTITDQFTLHMWWSVEKPTTGLTGNLTLI